MWKDRAIEHHVTPIAQLLVDNSLTDFALIVFVGLIADRAISVTASILISDDHTSYHDNFFDFADELKAPLRAFHDMCVANEEAWKAIRLEVSQNGNFDLLFEFDDAYRWDD